MIGRRAFLGGLAGWALADRILAQSEGVRLSVQGSAFQAYPLFVGVRSDPSLEEPHLEWEGKDYPLVWLADRSVWRAILPVGIDTSGKPVLKVKQSGSTLLERSIPVKPRDYGMQYLSINPDTLASYDDPQNKADDQAILASMKKLDTQQRWQGNFTYPCEAPETTGFGQRRLYNGWKKGWHKGLDLGGWEGQPVTSPAAGMVVHRARGLVNGNTLVLGHGLGLFSVYLHLNDIAVARGEEVQAGQTIASVGGTGGFAPHLHWEIRAFGGPVHPKAFFQLPADWR